MDCLPAATHGFRSEGRASNGTMVRLPGTRSCGEMRGSLRVRRGASGGALADGPFSIRG